MFLISYYLRIIFYLSTPSGWSPDKHIYFVHFFFIYHMWWNVYHCGPIIPHIFLESRICSLLDPHILSYPDRINIFFLCWCRWNCQFRIFKIYDITEFYTLPFWWPIQVPVFRACVTVDGQKYIIPLLFLLPLLFQNLTILYSEGASFFPWYKKGCVFLVYCNIIPRSILFMVCNLWIYSNMALSLFNTLSNTILLIQ